MTDEKDYVGTFFGCLYYYMDEIMRTDNKYNVKNQECFRKLYESMVHSFIATEDVYRLSWSCMDDFSSRLQRKDGGTKDKETKDEEAENKEMEVSQEIFAGYKDIDMFFGILHQCMMTLATDFKGNEGNRIFVKNVFDKTKEKFKQPEYADLIPWDRMWQVLMNSKVYSMVVERERKNRKVSCWEEVVYLDDRSFLDKLITEDTRKPHSYFVCVLKPKYIGFDIPNTLAYETDAIKKLVNRFKKIIQELDKEGQIEEIFTHRKGDEAKKPIWEVSAVDAEALYREIGKMEDHDRWKYWTAKDLYSRFCNEKGWKVSHEKIKELIKCFPPKRDCGDWYEEYKRLDRAAEILCQLVPMVSYNVESDSRYIKTYRKWKEDCERIKRILREKTLALGMEPVELKAAELVRNHMHELSDNEYEKSVQACFKEQYLKFLEEQSGKFLRSFDKVYGILENVDNKKDMEEMVKRVVGSLDIN